jgi:glutathione S-transferase
MLYLYHGTTSVCAVKARLTLAEKGLDWQGEVLDLQRGDQLKPEYRKLNPNAVVPTLVHDDHVVIESTLIIAYLDEAFPEPPLMPRAPHLRALARLWMKKIDDYLHPACSTVTFAIAFRPIWLKRSKEELAAKLAAMPDEAYRERQRLSIEHGLDAPHVGAAVRAHDRYIGEMEEQLKQTPYLAGERYSLADVAATPYVTRADMLGMEALWRSRPQVADWYGRMRARPSYEPAILRWLTDVDRTRFNIPRDEIWAKVEGLLTAA